MPAASWATARQEEFLQERLPQYREIFRTNKNYNDFWAELRHEWQKDENWSDALRLFPDTNHNVLDATQRQQLQAGIKATDERLQTWFRWRVNPAAQMGGRRGTAVKLEGTPKGRFYSLLELYSKTYYKDHIKQTVTARLGVLGKITPEVRIATIKAVTAECWANETDEIKAIIGAKYASQASPPPDDNGLRTPQQYLDAIKTLPNTLANYLRILAARTGYAFSVVMGGPSPDSPDGAIQVSSLHLGQTALGADFGHALPDFNKVFMPAYTEFLESIYPRNIRMMRVLGADTPMDVAGDMNADRSSQAVPDSSSETSINAASAPSDASPSPLLPIIHGSAQIANAPGEPLSTSPTGRTSSHPIPESSSALMVDSSCQASSSSMQLNANTSLNVRASTPSTQLAQRLLDANNDERELVNSNQNTLMNIDQELNFDFMDFMNQPLLYSHNGAPDQHAPFHLHHGQMDYPFPLPLHNGVSVANWDHGFGKPSFDLYSDRALDLALPAAGNAFQSSFGFTGTSGLALGGDSQMFSPPYMGEETTSAQTNMFSASAAQSVTLPSVTLCSPLTRVTPTPSSSSTTHDHLAAPQQSLPSVATTGRVTPPSIPNNTPVQVTHSALSPSLRSDVTTGSDASPGAEGSPPNFLNTLQSLTGTIVGASTRSLSSGSSTETSDTVKPRTNSESFSDGVEPPTEPSTPLPAPTTHSHEAADGVKPPAQPFLDGVELPNEPPMPPNPLPMATVCSQEGTANKGGRKALAPQSTNTTGTRQSARAPIPSSKIQQSLQTDHDGEQPTTANPPPAPKPNPPAWFYSARDFFLSHDLGLAWRSCVDSWVRLEEYLGYGLVAGTKTALPCTNARPDEWSKWAKTTQRSYLQVPSIPCSADLGLATMAWWYAMQPSARKTDKPGVLAPVYALSPLEWEPLCRAGANGVSSMMTITLWWAIGLSVRTQWQDDTTDKWSAHVADLSAVFNAMVEVKAGKPRKVPTGKGKENGQM